MLIIGSVYVDGLKKLTKCHTHTQGLYVLAMSMIEPGLKNPLNHAGIMHRFA